MCNARVQNNVQGNVQSNVHGKYASQMRKANAQLGQVFLFTETNVPAQEQIMPIRCADTCRADPIHAKPISIDPCRANPCCAESRTQAIRSQCDWRR